MVDRENVESGGRTWTDAPNGTGPFVLKEYRIGERIILERNENFYREKAHLDSIAMHLAGGQSMAMYENDEIDITGVGLFDLDRVLDPNEELNKEASGCAAGLQRLIRRLQHERAAVRRSQVPPSAQPRR